MGAYFDPSKTHCLVAVVSFASRILDRPENERFIASIPDPSRPDLGFSETGLALTFNVDSFTDLVEGHSFGKDSRKCDVLLDDPNGLDVDSLHFRLQLDYTQREPELDIINCSRRGTQVGNNMMTVLGQRVRVHQGDVVQILAGTVSLRLSYPFLDMSNSKILSRWNELRMTAWSLFPPSLRASLISPNIREEYIWIDASPTVNTGTMTVTLSKNKLAYKTGIAVIIKKPKANQNNTHEAAIHRLRHENIVTIFHIISPQGPVYLQEFTPHNSISAFLTSHNASRLKEDATMDLALQTLSALSHLYTNGITHPTISPQNILVFSTDPPSFKLTDFAALEASGNLNHWLENRVYEGNIHYTSPETFERGIHTPGAKASVWSLGIIMWELLTGNLPVAVSCRERTVTSAFRDVVNWVPYARELEDVGCSDEGTELVFRMCDRDVVERPGVQELMADECFEYLEVVRGCEPCDLQDSVL